MLAAATVLFIINRLKIVLIVTMADQLIKNVATSRENHKGHINSEFK